MRKKPKMKTITKTSKINPAEFMLTERQAAVYKLVKSRQNSGKVTTRLDIQNDLGGMDKSWICRVLKALIEKCLIERYEQRYYKLKN